MDIRRVEVEPRLVLQGRFVDIAPVSEKYLPFLYGLRTSPELPLVYDWRYLPTPNSHLQELSNEPYRVVVVDKVGEPVGSIYAYDVDIYNRRFFFTTHFVKRRSVYAVEGVLLFLRLMFTLTNAEQAMSWVLATNRLSLNTMVKNGFSMCGYVPDYFCWGGKYYDGVLLRMNRGRFFSEVAPKTERRLERLLNRLKDR